MVQGIFLVSITSSVPNVYPFVSEVTKENPSYFQERWRPKERDLDGPNKKPDKKL